MKLSPPLRIAAFVVGGIALLLVGLAAFAMLMPKGAIVAELEKRVEAALQRDLTIGGDVSFAFWPAIGFSAEDISLSNPEGFDETPFLSADKIVFAVALLPLIGGDIQVKSLVLEGAHVALEAKDDGAVNWTFPTEEAGENEAPSIEDLKLEDVRLVDGEIRFAGPEGEPVVVSDVDASLGLESLDKPSALNASFDYRGERVTLDTELGAPRALLEQGKTPLNAKLKSDALNAEFDGELDTATAALAGQLDARGRSLRRLIAWTGTPLEAGPGFGAFSVTSRMTHEGDATALTGGAFRIDDIAARGDVRILAREGKNLRVEGALSSESLDLNPYLPAPTQGGGAAGVDASTAWTTTPLDLSGLRTIDADLTFKTATLLFQKLRFSDVDLRLGIANGVADARLDRISLYGGSGSARLVADARGATPRIAAELDAQNVQALGLLTDAIGVKMIEGRGRLTARVAGAGASQAAIMHSLDGTAGFTFNDGKIKGFDLASVARTVTAVLSGNAVGPSSATDFAELGAQFRINDGVAVTDDLRLLNPFVRMSGAGLINIGEQNLDMRIEPRAVRSSEGQGSTAATSGIGVPFRVSGPWAQPRFQAALGEVVQNELQTRAREALAKQDPNSPLGVLSTAIFGPRPAASTQSEPAAGDATETPAAAEAPAEAEKQEEAPAEQSAEDRLKERARDALGGLFKRN